MYVVCMYVCTYVCMCVCTTRNGRTAWTLWMAYRIPKESGSGRREQSRLVCMDTQTNSTWPKWRTRLGWRCVLSGCGRASIGCRRMQTSRIHLLGSLGKPTCAKLRRRHGTSWSYPGGRVDPNGLPISVRPTHIRRMRPASAPQADPHVHSCTRI